MNLQHSSRRKVMVLALAAWASRPATSLAARPRAAKVPIGIQLWSVRDDCIKDIDATLKRVAACGFAGVEFAGFYKYEHNAKALRATLDSLGLQAAGAHLSVRAFQPARLAQTVDFYQTLGCKLLIVGGDRRFTDPEGSKLYAQEMNVAAESLKPAGLFCGHHNHKEEFAQVDNTTYWDLFAQRTSPDVFLQLDIGWVFEAGLDPVALLERYPNRYKTLHLRGKVAAGVPHKLPIIGKDTLNWPGIIGASLNGGGAEWLVVEQEEIPTGMTQLSSSRQSLRGLQQILARYSARQTNR